MNSTTEEDEVNDNANAVEGEGDDPYADYYDFDTVDIISFQVARVAAAISLVASIVIMLETRHATLLVHRILFWMQFGLILHSLAAIVGIAALSDERFYGAYGTQFTCSLQGFALQLGITLALFWDMALSVVFLLIVKYNWPNSRLCNFMKICHCIIWPVAIIIAVIPLFLQLYNPHWDLCWPAAYPFECEDPEGDYEFVKCERGDYGQDEFYFYFNVFCMVAAIATSIYCMTLLYCHVREIERRSYRYSFDSQLARRSSGATSSVDHHNNNHHNNDATTHTAATTTNQAEDRKRSRAVAIQGICYSTTIIVANVPTVVSVYWSTGWFLVFTAASRNLYAFYYLLVYLRMQPKLQTTAAKWIHYLLLQCCGCCSFYCCKCNWNRCQKQQSEEVEEEESITSRRQTVTRCTINDNNNDNEGIPPPAEEDLEHNGVVVVSFEDEEEEEASARLSGSGNNGNGNGNGNGKANPTEQRQQRQDNPTTANGNSTLLLLNQQHQQAQAQRTESVVSFFQADTDDEEYNNNNTHYHQEEEEEAESIVETQS